MDYRMVRIPMTLSELVVSRSAVPLQQPGFLSSYLKRLLTLLKFTWRLRRRPKLRRRTEGSKVPNIRWPRRGTDNKSYPQ